MLTVSEDGYIRLSFVELRNFRLAHLISGLDDNEGSRIAYGATQSTITGYTEWLSDSMPKITIGWDWSMDFVDNRICLLRIGMPRSNLMLQDVNSGSMGYEKSILLLAIFVDGMNWQSVVREHINDRYC